MVQMVKYIHIQIMECMNTRRTMAKKWTTLLCPEPQKLLIDNISAHFPFWLNRLSKTCMKFLIGVLLQFIPHFGPALAENGMLPAFHANIPVPSFDSFNRVFIIT